MNKIRIDEFLRIPLFQDLKGETLELLREAAYKVELRRGEGLFLERDSVDTIYIVLIGKAAMYKMNEDGQKKVIYILDEGQILNEVVFDEKPASISCNAFETLQLICFNRNELLGIMERDFELTKRVINMMARKIRRLYRQLKNTVPIKMDKKVAAKLWKLSRDYGIEVPEGTLINLKITITYLADMLGSPRETISRSIKALEEKGLVIYKDRKMIVNTESLAEYYRSL